MKKSISLDIRYSIIQAIYLMFVCVAVGFASAYLLDKGFNNAMIGVVFSVSNMFAVVLQPTLANYVDTSTKVSVKQLVSAIIGILFLLSIVVWFISSIKMVLLITMILLFTGLMTIMPFINSLSFAFEQRGYTINFGLARGMGSASYAITSLVLGNIIETYDVSILPLFYIGLSIALWYSVFSFKTPKNIETIEKEEKPIEEQVSLWKFSKKYYKLMFLLFGFVFVYFAHTIINNFFFQIVTNVGGTNADMGSAIFVGAVLELPAMFLFTKICKRIDCGKLIIASAIIFSLKHVLTYFATNMIMLYVAQCLQAGAYALFVPASVYYVSKLVERHDLNKGQAMVTGAMMLSGVFASLLGGVLLDVMGASHLLLIGAIASIIGSIIMCVSTQKVEL